MILAYLAWRAWRESGYAFSLGQRLGRLPASFRRTGPGAIWLHAVSVGEVLSTQKLIARLRQELPHAPLYLSCSTVAGYHVACSTLPDSLDGIFYAPLDYCFAVRSVLRRLQPLAVVVFETEIWPNLFRETCRSGAALLMVNARISDKAWPRYRRWRWFFSPVVRLPRRILAQSELDAERFRQLGAPAERIAVSGNLKYDLDPSPGVAPEIQAWSGHPLWLAASTSAPVSPGDVDEDDVVLETHQRLCLEFPNLKLILAPRKPERFAVVAEKLLSRGLAFVRRTELKPGDNAPILLLDTIGELASVCSLADVVFMGGTLAARGGHNILEPAAFGKAIVVGPHMENFAAICAEFVDHRGLVQIQSAEHLCETLAGLLRDAKSREELGRRARQLRDARRGATRQAAEVIVSECCACFARPVYGLFIYLALWPLSLVWRSVHALRARWIQPRELAGCIFSVGGLTLGGAGKTPLVRELVKMIGAPCAVLTRGYGRRGRELLVLPPGAKVPAEETGDEAQLYLADGAAWMGIGANRRQVACRLRESHGIEIFVLDDGFQHFQLKRDCDIVALDALDPFGGGRVFPLGFLREPPSALRRAHAVVITSAERRPRLDTLCKFLREQNPRLAIFQAVSSPDANFDGQRVAAFCGLAQPEKFFASLRAAGARLVLTRAFADHHRYNQRELEEFIQQAMRVNAELMLTTEKDAANLPANRQWPFRVVRLRLRIVEGEAFQAFLSQFCSHHRLGVHSRPEALQQ